MSNLEKDIMVEEKELKAPNGLIIAILILISHFVFIGAIVFFGALMDMGYFSIIGGLLIVFNVLCFIASLVMWGGIKILKPQEALVITLFGKYKGTLKKAGIYFVNPFSIAVNPAATTTLRQSGDVGVSTTPSQQEIQLSMKGLSKKISLKQMTLNNNRQKINDRLGNPIEIGIAVIWRVDDTAKAVFNVDNYMEFLSIQCDIALRNIVKIYPYDVAENIDTTGDGEPDEGSLRGSSELVSRQIRDEIQRKVENAGIEIIDAKITYLAYAQEIAAVMLQRQQASAIIDARKMIVDGAVSMVEMAIDKLNEGGRVELDDERKAAMVSNLLVVLCGNKDAQPVVNSGSLY